MHMYGISTKLICNLCCYRQLVTSALLILKLVTDAVGQGFGPFDYGGFSDAEGGGESLIHERLVCLKCLSSIHLQSKYQRSVCFPLPPVQRRALLLGVFLFSRISTPLNYTLTSNYKSLFVLTSLCCRDSLLLHNPRLPHNCT